MQANGWRKQISGVVQGNQLTGTEILDEVPKKLRSFHTDSQAQCRLAISATRQ